jgi:K+-transporting ATPase ATPase B chain
MIAMVEGAKTPEDTERNRAHHPALRADAHLPARVVTLKPFGIYAGMDFSVPVLIALLVCLIPTTIGGLLSAIGISGIDRLIRRNVMATSGRAVEAAGDIDVLLLDKTGTITSATAWPVRFPSRAWRHRGTLADAAQLASLADETPEGRSIVVLAKEKVQHPRPRSRRIRTPPSFPSPRRPA